MRSVLVEEHAPDPVGDAEPGGVVSSASWRCGDDQQIFIIMDELMVVSS